MIRENATDPVSRLVFELSKLPGIGEKTAARLAYHVLKQDENYARALSQALLNAKQKIGLCSVCFTFTESNPCRTCTGRERDARILCIVERPSDVFAIESSGSCRWSYHVLHGALSPLDGVGPEDLKIGELLTRIRTLLEQSENSPIEAILATNPSVEGEATALYLTKLLRPLGVRTTRLAHGLPVGGVIEYTDRQTLFRALENRVEVR